MDLTGKHIAITGTALNYNRAEIAAEIAARGGIVATAVNKRTDLLVIGERKQTGVTKRDAADRYGVPTIQAAAFMSILKGEINGQLPFRPPLPPKPTRVAAKVAKQVDRALSEMSKNPAMTGFVGF